MFEIWIIFALFAALSQAVNPLVNEYFKISSIYLLFWLRLIVCAVLTPIALQFPVPQDWMFYASVLGAVSCFAYFDLVYFSQAATRGAGMITRFEGLVVAVTFILWLLINPALVVKYIDEPLRGAGITASFAGGIYFALKMRKCTLTLAALREMLPALLLGGLGIVFGKLAMVHAPTHSGVWYYAALQSLLAVVIYTVVLNVPLLSRHFTRADSLGLWNIKVFKAAACLSVGWGIHTICKYYAITDVENPAYVTIIGLTAPLWVVGIYRAIGRREQADVKAGLGLVFCAAALVCFAHL